MKLYLTPWSGKRTSCSWRKVTFELYFILCVLHTVLATITWRVLEESKAGTLVGNLGQLTAKFRNYDLVTSSNNFVYDKITGNVSTKQIIDRDILSTQCINGSELETVQFSSTTTGDSDIHVDVFIDDINDNWPQFTSDLFTRTISEGASKGVVVQISNAKDNDCGDNAALQYKVLNTADFTVKLSTNKEFLDIVSVKKLDREEIEFHIVIIQACDHGKPPKCNRTILNITVSDFNDNRPVFNDLKQQVEVEEKCKSGSNFIMALNVSDKDSGKNGQFTLSVSDASEDSKLFHITDNKLFSTKCLTYDKRKPFINIVITAVDHGVPQQHNDVNIRIAVIDINDHHPVLSKILQKPVIENEDVSHFVALLRVTDDDDDANANVSLKITSGNPNRKFYLEKLASSSDLFYLKLRGTLDREYISVYNLTIEGSDHGNPPLRSYLNVEIQVQDENDNYPSCSFQKEILFLSESSPVGSFVTVVQGTDNDEGSNSEMKYSMPDENNSGVFKIITSSGLITTNAVLDYEMQTSITLRVQVEDNGTPKLSSFCSLIINITDVNDNTPVFTNSTFTFDVYEDAVAHSIVANLTAYDADSGINAKLTFSILFQSPLVGKTFHLNSETGAMKILTSLDRENHDFYQFCVLVEDNGNPKLSSTAMVEFTILDTNDNHPVFYPRYYFVNINVNQTDGFIANVTAVDVDKNDVILYEIAERNPINGEVSVNASTGTVRYDRISQLDANDVLTLNLTAKDSEGHISHVSMLYVTIITSKDDLPHFQMDLYSFSIEENVQDGTFVGIVKATSMKNVGILYYIYSGDRDGIFFINEHGEIRTSGDVDHEKQSTFNLQVVARTLGRRKLTAQTSVFIVVEDVNDNAPEFQYPQKSITVENNAPVDSVVYKLKALDPDSGSGGIVKYEMFNGIHAGFSILASGDLVVDKDLAHVINYSPIISIVASDFGLPQLSSVLNLTINIIKGNRHPPVINRNFGIIHVLRNIPINTLFFNITALDPDGNDSEIYFHALGTEHATDFFGIFPEGNLYIKQPLILTNQSDFAVEIMVIDRGIPQLNSTFLIQISVLTTEWHQQQLFQKDTFKFEVYENEKSGTVVGMLDFVAKFQNLQVDFVEEYSYFTFDHMTNEIKTKQVVDYEQFKLTTGSRNYIIYAEASYNNHVGLRIVDLATVVIEVSDRNDHIPMFSELKYIVDIKENQKVGSDIFKLITYDEDENENAMVNFTIFNSSLSNVVIVDKMGNIVLNTPLENKHIFYFNFSVQVMNVAPPYNYSTCFVEVNIHDINNNKPHFLESLITTRNPEDIGIGEMIYRASASDSDSGRNGRLTYTIISGNQERNFKIDRGSGDIILVRELDFEKVQSYILTISAKDSGILPLSSTQILIVNITDVNDNAPHFTSCQSYLKIQENASVNSVVMQCLAVDSDTGDNGIVVYSISREKPTGNNFRIGKNGTLYVNKRLDREQFPVYKIDVRAEDSAIPVTSRLMRTKTIAIELEDVNDNSPRFVSPPSVYFTEFASQGDYVTTLKAWDPDVALNGVFRFSKGSGVDADVFNVSDSGRVIFVKSPSKKVVYEVNVIVTDSGQIQRKSEQELSVFMYKEGGLAFLQSRYSATIQENELAGSFVINVIAVATEHNDDTQVRYFMTNDSSEGLFSLDSSTGVVSVKEKIDREGKHGPEVKFVIYAADINSATPKSTSVSVYLTIIDLNDNIPTFTEYTYTADILENIQIGSSVLTLKARDDDEGRNGSIAYEIVGGNAKNGFFINSDTGKITVANNLDHEVQSLFVLNVTASDNGKPRLSSWTIVSVNILDVNDNMPAFLRLNYSFTVVENSPLKTVIGRAIAFDVDSGANGQLTYSLTGNDAHLFTVNVRTGTIRNAFSFDREKIDFYLFKVVATDNGNPSLSAVAFVYVSILDENDNSPIFSTNQPHIATVLENSLVGTPVITVNASDVDVGLNSTLNYAITGGNHNKAFRIVNYGTLLTASVLDRENIAQYNLKITVSDSATVPSERRSSKTTIIVFVDDVNDHTPYFVSEDVIHVREDQDLAKPFASILAKDRDTGLNGEVVYELHGHVAKMFFQIDQDSGELSLRKTLDREETTTGNINITVEAKDHGQPPNRNQQYIQIFVDDVNDNSPIFKPHLELLNVYENISIGSELLRVAAVDKDQGLNGKVEYAITAGNSNQTFSIHPIDGIITLIKPLDRESIQNYQIDVTAFDFGSPVQENITTVHIHLLDVNDNEPRFTNPPSSKGIKENVRYVENLAKFVAVDNDEGKNGEVVYSIINPVQTPFLSIDNVTGVVSLIAPLDREVKSSYSVIIQAKDEGNPFLSTQTEFKILVQDENDNSPLFVNPELKPIILEGLPVGSQLCVMNATDADSGSNAVISYELVNDFGWFRIDPKTGEILTIAQLDRELHGSEFKLTVKASDQGNPSRVTCVAIIGRIEDIDDNKAEFESKTYSAYLPVSASTGTFVTVTSAEDKDEGLNGKVIYKIEGISREFRVDRYTGYISTITNMPSSVTRYTIKIQAINAKSNILQDTAAVDITTTTSHFPSFNIPVNVYNISEDARPGYFILNVKATDNPSLQITSGDPNKQFSLDIVSKNLTLKKNLDYESKRHYSLWLSASLNTIYSTYINIQIFVVDSNDNIPIFEQLYYEIFVMENENTSVSMSCIIAEDRDTGAYGFVEYKILEAAALNWFQINAYTGCISTTRAIDREQNLSFNFTVQARDHGLPSNTNNASVHVNILDRNDNSPILDKLSPVFVSEDKLPTFLVATAFAHDHDETSNLLYFLETQGNYRNTFCISNETGRIFLVKRLDRETVDRYPLTISVTDGKFSDQTSLVVNVKDVDDNPPRLSNNFCSVKFMELQPVGSVVIQLNISDKDIGRNTDVVYSFKRTLTSDMFRIHPSGIITAARLLRFVKPTKDNEITNIYNLTVCAENPSHPSAKPSATVSVEVTDANDHYPVFERNEYHSFVPSVSKIDTRIDIIVQAVDNYDVGRNSEVVYKIVDGNGTRMFGIEPTMGFVTVKSDISSESDKLFFLEIQASDLGAPPRISPTNATVFITVTIENQYPPKFNQKKYRKELKENYVVGKEFLRVLATDSDSGMNGKVKYSILPGKQGKFFNIDKNTGSISIANVKLDYEYLKEYSFDIEAKDCAPISRKDQATVTVTVLDYNDNLPEFQKSVYDVVIAENNQIGAEVITVSATDRDTVGDTITYTLAGKPKDFTIDQNSGKITTNVMFDYESQSSFNMTVLAKDSGDPRKTSDCTVFVKILGINEFRPEFDKKIYVFTVREDVRVGSNVGQVSATDKDDGPDGVVQFMLVDPSGRHSNFDVNKFTGHIYVCGRLDFETENLVYLTVLVKNPVQRILNADNTDTANVTIRIVDTNDPPRFLKDFIKVSVPENVPVGRILGNFTAVDEDTRSNFLSLFKYTIFSGNINQTFTLDNVGQTVLVKTNKHLDREIVAMFNLTIAVIVISNTNLRSFADLIVEVQDINDNPPYLKPNICPGHIQENLESRAVVLRFDASDQDVDPNKDPYTFEITNKEYVPFVINRLTSELQTSERLDREKVPLFVLQIKILDSGYPKQFTFTSCTVIVDDVNDNKPSADTLNVKINVPATGYRGGVIADVSPLDLDAIKEYTCKVEGNYKDTFDFESKSCMLNMKKPILQRYFLDVVAHDAKDHVQYSLNVSFNKISETTSGRSAILRLSGISPQQFLSVMNYLPCVPGYEKEIYSVQKVSSTLTDVLLAHLQNSVYISRDKLSEILTNCKNILERKFDATIVDTNYDICLSSNPCIHGTCKPRVMLSPGNRTTLYSGTEIFLSAYHKATFRCVCNSGYSGEYCQFSTKICEGIECRNAGRCIPTDQGFKCLCPPNFTGKFCDTAVNLCDPNPCSNTSQCLSTNEGVKCQCDFGGRGKRCELSSIGFKSLSYMMFPSLSSTDGGTRNNISLQIATVKRNALIFYNDDGKTDENSHFIALEIIDGLLRYSFSLGNGVVHITADLLVSDGTWHNVAVLRDKQVRIM